ncbi:MAG: PqqD family protein [Acidobacteria bacterium]|nr:PqqD family protein [Acidobacteriota bacterium]
MTGAYVRSDNVVARRIGGETLIVPVRGGVGDLACIYSLNGVASTLWSCLSEPQDKESLMQAILQDYEVTAERAQQDLQAFLAEMESAGLVRNAETG